MLQKESIGQSIDPLQWAWPMTFAPTRRHFGAQVQFNKAVQDGDLCRFELPQQKRSRQKFQFL